MNKAYFDGLTKMFQLRSDFDASMLRMLEEAVKMGDGEKTKTVTPIPAGVVGSSHWGTIRLNPHTEKWARTEAAPWFAWKLYGFGFAGSPPETVQIRTLRVGGSRNLLWHEEWVPLSAYLLHPLTPRDIVVITAPNYAELELRNSGDAPAEFGLWILGEPVENAS